MCQKAAPEFTLKFGGTFFCTLHLLSEKSFLATQYIQLPQWDLFVLLLLTVVCCYPTELIWAFFFCFICKSSNFTPPLSLSLFSLQLTLLPLPLPPRKASLRFDSFWRFIVILSPFSNWSEALHVSAFYSTPPPPTYDLSLNLYFKKLQTLPPTLFRWALFVLFLSTLVCCQPT